MQVITFAAHTAHLDPMEPASSSKLVDELLAADRDLKMAEPDRVPAKPAVLRGQSCGQSTITESRP
jgi:hypothetical protein